MPFHALKFRIIITENETLGGAFLGLPLKGFNVGQSGMTSARLLRRGPGGC